MLGDLIESESICRLYFNDVDWLLDVSIHVYLLLHYILRSYLNNYIMMSVILVG